MGGIPPYWHNCETCPLDPTKSTTQSEPTLGWRLLATVTHRDADCGNIRSSVLKFSRVGSGWDLSHQPGQMTMHTRAWLIVDNEDHVLEQRLRRLHSALSSQRSRAGFTWRCWRRAALRKKRAEERRSPANFAMFQSLSLFGGVGGHSSGKIPGAFRQRETHLAGSATDRAP